jgi:hypothetical protein
MAAVAEMKQEWKLFKDDEPGHRFTNHRDRMRKRSRKLNVLGLVVGIALLAAGVAFCFLPGPGTVLIVFGLALVGARWERMAKLMDRAEPRVRHFGHRQKQRWKAMPGSAKLSVMLGLAAFAVAGLLFMWRFVVSAYLLG